MIYLFTIETPICTGELAHEGELWALFATPCAAGKAPWAATLHDLDRISYPASVPVANTPINDTSC